MSSKARPAPLCVCAQLSAEVRPATASWQRFALPQLLGRGLPCDNLCVGDARDGDYAQKKESLVFRCCS